jgi:hypothetical protein
MNNLNLYSNTLTVGDVENMYFNNLGDLSLSLPLNNTDYSDNTTASYVIGDDGDLSGWIFNHGSLENGATVTSNGLELDGVDDYVDIQLLNRIGESGETMSAWVFTNQRTNSYVVYSNRITPSSLTYTGGFYSRLSSSGFRYEMKNDF